MRRAETGEVDLPKRGAYKQAGPAKKKAENSPLVRQARTAHSTGDSFALTVSGIFSHGWRIPERRRAWSRVWMILDVSSSFISLLPLLFFFWNRPPLFPPPFLPFLVLVQPPLHSFPPYPQQHPQERLLLTCGEGRIIGFPSPVRDPTCQDP